MGKVKKKDSSNAHTSMVVILDLINPQQLATLTDIETARSISVHMINQHILTQRYIHQEAQKGPFFGLLYKKF